MNLFSRIALVLLLAGVAVPLLGQDVVTEPPVFEAAMGTAIARLPFRIIDAEFSQSLNAIVAVAENPFALHIYDPETDTTRTVLLHLVPRCVSVSPDGKKAAVGHDGLISYVDLENATLVKTLDVSTDVLDIILPGNGWVYAFPRTDQWETIRCVEIATNMESQHIGGSIYAGTVARLHPGGASIYGADRGLSPADIEKYDISKGVASYKYDSPYHGDYSMCGDLWMSVDGASIFTACGNVFRASDDPNVDMRYKGSLSQNKAIQWVAHSSAASTVVVVPSSNSYFYYSTPRADQDLYYYTADVYAYRGKMLLPSFTVEDKQWQSRGRWLFFNAGGTKQYVVVQADAESGMLYDFGVVTVDCTNASVAITPGSASLSSAAANLTVTVTGSAGCGWRATTTDSWINTLSSGVGDGTAVISVASNNTLAARTGTVTIGSKTFTIEQAALVPGPVNAKANVSGSISVSWPAASVDHFEVWRRSAQSDWTLAGTSSTSSFTDGTVSPSSAYVYKVRAIVAGGASSAFSAPDYAHTFSYTDPATIGLPLRAVHVTELRTVINALRLAAGSGTAAFTDASLAGVPAKLVHLTELRDALAALRSALGMSAYSFSPAYPGTTIGQQTAEARTATQ